MRAAQRGRVRTPPSHESGSAWSARRDAIEVYSSLVSPLFQYADGTAEGDKPPGPASHAEVRNREL